MPLRLLVSQTQTSVPVRHRLDADQQVQLLHILGGIAPESADLREWNDALDYIVGWGPATGAEEAKQLLIKSLGG